LENRKRRSYLEELGVNGKIILKWFLKNYCGIDWTVFIGSRIKTSGELL
jgi:hypothetical protein